ncbi:MAG: deoxyribonuclease IV [Bacillota bacterium]
MKTGAHLSISGGVDKSVKRAEELGADAVQLFAKNPRGWSGKSLTAEAVEQFATKRSELESLATIVHANYLTNLATPKDELYQKSKASLKDDIRRADRLGIDYVVFHPGNHTGSGVEAGIKRINQALQEILADVEPETKLLLENVAGAGTEIGQNWSELLQMVEGISLDQVGVCLDTCHAFAAGYDLRTKSGIDQLLVEIDDTFGLENLPVLHVNDSKGELGNHKDRHYHIGQGEIGLEGFKYLINRPALADKIFILETPVDEHGDDELNLKTLRGLVE